MDQTHWDKVLKPDRSLFDIRLKEIWRYRDLLWLFVKRDFVSFYKQTILGPFWFFIQPIFTTIVFLVIFGRMARIGTGDMPAPLFYLAGITCWNYFADCLTKTSTVFKDNANIFGKVYFPRLIMPLSIVVSCLVRFGVQMLLFILVLLYYLFTSDKLHINAAITLLPLLIVLMALLGLGIGLIITALTTKYRDLSFLVVFGIQLAMYATPVVYPLSFAPPKYRNLIEMNPMTGIIETFRAGFSNTGSFSTANLYYSLIATLVLLVAGVLIFNKTEKDFVDTI